MTAQTWKVVFYSAAHSRKGDGMRVALFTTEAAAQDFAADKVAYGKPAKAELVPALSPAQEVVANRAAFGGSR